MPFASAWIAEINAAIDAATHEPAVGQLRPIAGAHDARIPRAHVKHAVGIAAERELLFEPIHRDSGLFLLSIAVKNSGDLRLYIDTVLLMPKDFKVQRYSSSAGPFTLLRSPGTGESGVRARLASRISSEDALQSVATSLWQ